MKKIALTQGKFAIVDDEDFEWLNQWKWIFVKAGYAKRSMNLNLGAGQQKTLSMHREIIGAKEGEFVDHVSGDGLDNRRCNLRICSRAENNRNSKVREDNKSGYKGVNWQPSAKKWQAQIAVMGKIKYLGVFENKEDAAAVYNEAAKQYHGEFARLNVIT